MANPQHGHRNDDMLGTGRNERVMFWGLTRLRSVKVVCKATAVAL